MATLTAARSGTFRIGGELEVHRLGYGAMRVTGEGIWGPPADKAESLRVLRRLPELGVNSTGIGGPRACGAFGSTNDTLGI